MICLSRGFTCRELARALTRSIARSSLPMRAVETTFAPDSSGFCTSRFTRWFDVKYGVTRETADWVKVHLITGVKTTISFQQAILQDPNFRRGVYSTTFIEQLLSGARRELIEEKA